MPGAGDLPPLEPPAPTPIRSQRSAVTPGSGGPGDHYEALTPLHAAYAVTRDRRMREELAVARWSRGRHGLIEVTPNAPAGGLLSGGTEIAGALLARRYGYEAAILVRVDDVGEIYPRLAEDGDTTSPARRLLTDEDDE